MLTILFFDTETNGLPKDRNGLTTNTENWPYILQISWSIISCSSERFDVLEQQTHYIEFPEGVPFDTEAAKIHKIEEAVVRSAVPSREVLEKFRKAAQASDVIVAHNLAFDKSVLWASYYRLNSQETFSWWPTHDYCTMIATKNLIKLPSKYAKPNDLYKLPRLVELYRWLFNKEPEGNLHSADADVAVLITCFRELLARRVVPFDLWKEAFLVRMRLRSDKLIKSE